MQSVFENSALSLFQKTKPLSVLKKNLYSYRERAYEPDFHYLVGSAMFQMGFLHEAYMAYNKAFAVGGLLRDKLFSAVVLMHAARYEECLKVVKEINADELSLAELAVYIDVLERLGVPDAELVTKFSSGCESDGGVEARMLLALHLAQKGAMKANLLANMLKDDCVFDDYMDFLRDMHTAGLPEKNCADILLNIEAPKESVGKYLKTVVATRSLIGLDAKERQDWFRRTRKGLSDDDLAKLVGVMYDVAEYEKSKPDMERWYRKEEQLYRHGVRSEQGMLVIGTHLLKRFEHADHAHLKDVLWELVGLDQSNMLYRKLSFELLMQIGRPNEAQKVNEASIRFRLAEEKELAGLLRAFHGYYGIDVCPILSKEKCPLCHGGNERPEFKVVCFNTSPRQMYAEHVETATIAIKDEETMRRLFDWQPMHVASPVAGEYLKSLGAYQSTRDYPDSLAEGEVYVFLHLRKESLQRLIREGYSLRQIDPMLPIMLSHRKTDALDASPVDKPTDYKGIISAKDLVLEIVRAVPKPEEEP